MPAPQRIPVGTELAILGIHSPEELVTPTGQPFSLIGEVGVVQEELELNPSSNFYKGTIRFDTVTTGSNKGNTSWWSEGWQVRVISWSEEEPRPQPRPEEPTPEAFKTADEENPIGPPAPESELDQTKLKQKIVVLVNSRKLKRKIAGREVSNCDALLGVARALCNHTSNRTKLEYYQQAQIDADAPEVVEVMSGPILRSLLEASYNTAVPSGILSFVQMAGWIKHWPGVIELYEKSRGQANAGVMAEQSLDRAADIARRAKEEDPRKRNALIFAAYLSYLLIAHDGEGMSDEEKRAAGTRFVEEFLSKVDLDTRTASYIRSLLAISPLGHKEMSFLLGEKERIAAFKEKVGDDLPLVFYLVASTGIHSSTTLEAFKTALSAPQIDILIAAVTKEDLNVFLEKTGVKRKGSIKSILEACQLEAMKSSEENPYLLLSKVLKIKIPDTLPSDSRRLGIVPGIGGATPQRMADGSIVRVVSCINYNAEGIGLDPVGLIATVRVVSMPFHKENPPTTEGSSSIEGPVYHGMLEFTELPPGVRTRKAREPFQGTGFSAIWHIEPISVTPDNGDYPEFSCPNEQK